MKHQSLHFIFYLNCLALSVCPISMAFAQQPAPDPELISENPDQTKISNDSGELLDNEFSNDSRMPENIPQEQENFVLEQGFEDGFIPVAEDIELDENGMESLDSEYDQDSETSQNLPANLGEISLPNPVYEISEIIIVGNKQTSRERILSMMDISEGSRITLNELEETRFQMAVSGAFKSVEMTLVPDKSHHKMGIRLDVVENAKLQINDYWLGTSEKSPFWMGMDVTWVAPFSLPHRMRLAFGATTTNDYTLNFTYLIPSFSKYSLSMFATLQSTLGHEGLFGHLFIPAGFDEDHQMLTSRTYLGDLTYHNNGLTFGMGYAPAENIRLMFRLQYAHIRKGTTDPRLDSPTHDFLAHPETNHPTISVMASFDNRHGHALPTSGHLVSANIRGTFRSAMSDYQYIRANLFHQSNFGLAPQHILRLQTFAGLIYGDSPFFERFFYNDFYSFAPSRFQNLNPSDKGAFDLFHTGASSLSYEDFLVHLALTYAWQPMRQLLELFITVSATYADSFEQKALAIGIQPTRDRSNFPVDMSFNAGIRMQTTYGLVSITLAHIINLIPRSK